MCSSEINVSRCHPLNTSRGKCCWMCRVSLHHSANIPIVWHSGVFERLHFKLVFYLDTWFEWFVLNICLQKMLYVALNIGCLLLFCVQLQCNHMELCHMINIKVQSDAHFQMLEMPVRKTRLNNSCHKSIAHQKKNEKSCLALNLQPLPKEIFPLKLCIYKLSHI